MKHSSRIRTATAALSTLVTFVAVAAVFTQGAAGASMRWGIFDPVSDGSAFIMTGQDDRLAQRAIDTPTGSSDDYDHLTQSDTCDAAGWSSPLLSQDVCGYKATVFGSDPSGQIHTSSTRVYSPGHYGNGEMVARVRGESCQGAPRLKVTIDNGSGIDVMVFDTEITSTDRYTSMRTQLRDVVSGERRRVKVSLANPLKTAACERRLWVDYVGFRPRTRNTVAAPDGATRVSDAGATNGTPTATLIASGTTRTPVVSRTTVKVGWMAYETMALRVRSGGTCGGQAPRMRVAFRGNTYVDRFVGNTAYPATYDGLVEGDMSSGMWTGAVDSTVTITLVNPYRSRACSRRLYVDYISILPSMERQIKWASEGSVEAG